MSSAAVKPHLVSSLITNVMWLLKSPQTTTAALASCRRMSRTISVILLALSLRCASSPGEIAVEYMYLLCTRGKCGPIKGSTQRFHQREACTRGGRCPAPTVSLKHCLVCPEVLQVKLILELGLVETNYMRSGLLDNSVQSKLLRCTIETSYVEFKDGELT